METVTETIVGLSRSSIIIVNKVILAVLNTFDKKIDNINASFQIQS